MPSNKPYQPRKPQFASAAIAIAMLCSVTANSWAQSSANTAGNSQSAKPATPVAPAAPAALTTTPAVAPSTTLKSANIQTVDAIAAVVNSDVITRQELAARTRDIVQRMKTQGIEVPPEAELRKQMLERLILEKAQIQSAKDQGISVDDRMLDTAIARIAENNKLSMDAFRAQLAHDNINYPDFREEIRREILLQRLREREVDNKIQISESEVDNYMQAEAKNKQDQGPTQELNLAQILIRVPENPSPVQIAVSQKRAEEVLQKLKAGESFDKVAAAYSDAPDALSGGELGWRPASAIPQLFGDALAKLSPGEVTPILKSPNGFHIVKLNSKRVAPAAKDDTAAPTEQTHAEHILIKVTPTVTAEQAKNTLLKLKERIDHGENFEVLAKQYSNDLSAAKGGDLGWLFPGDTVPEFQRAMDALKPGEVSEPIESPFGFHLIKVLERKSDTASVDRKRLAARQAIRERKTEEATNEWLRKLRDEAYVEYREDN
ncbi:peptidylprolyl isomerase [Glaciimonas soli]|uniref:Chaperone SurA n=1 Tax=Glaciimonas soli TaxID=2590999 RepID=A0A843YPY0_9BURK|nr:peptidylprolyl isomerase [Glaciimonas soli]MQR01849.1 molecular chaperone SurA [Glaciimonas soli]